MESNKDIEIKVDKESQKTETKLIESKKSKPTKLLKATS